MFCMAHFFFLISEHLSKKFMDITNYEELDDYAPNVVICMERPLVARKMDLLVNYYGNCHLDRCPKLSIDVLALNRAKIVNKFQKFTRDQNILGLEQRLLKDFDDIVARCHSRGFMCGSEDFDVFPRYIRMRRLHYF